MDDAICCPYCWNVLLSQDMLKEHLIVEHGYPEDCCDEYIKQRLLAIGFAIEYLTPQNQLEEEDE